MPDMKPPPPMPGTKPSSLDCALQEYNTLHHFYLEIYRLYYRTLAMIGVALAAIGALTINNLKNLDPGIVGLLAIILALCFNIWFAGWAYVNRELWSYRMYIRKLEEYVCSESEVHEKGAPFNFYRSDLFGMYGGYTRVLNICFAVPLLVFYSFLVLLAFSYGFDAIADEAIAKKLISESSRSEWIIRSFSPGAFLILTLVPLGSSLGAKMGIGRKQKAMLAKWEPTTKIP